MEKRIEKLTKEFIEEKYGNEICFEKVFTDIKDDYGDLIDLRNRIKDGTDDDTTLYEEDSITLDHALDYVELLMQILRTQEHLSAIELPQFNAILYYDWIDDRLKFYDSNKNYLDCFSCENETEFKTVIDTIKSQNDIIDLYAMFCNSFDYGNTIKECLYGYLETDFEDAELEKQVKQDLKTMDEEQLIEAYDLNKIGKMYFKGEW